jgi:CheY-like chemotaxis protein
LTEENKSLICFIDDSADERDLFQQVFGCDDGAFSVITAESFEEARTLLGETDQIPALFVLDLYFPTDANPESMSVDKIGPVTLPGDEGDLIKAWHNVGIAQKRYNEIRDAQGQSPRGGLRLIVQVQEAFPGIPIITYTRKGTVEEAEAARRTGARRVLQKPSGIDWIDTGQLTESRRAEMEAVFQQTIKNDPYEILNLIMHYSGVFLGNEAAREIAATVSALRRKLVEEPTVPLERDEVYQLMDTTQHPFIRALIFLLIP